MSTWKNWKEISSITKGSDIETCSSSSPVLAVEDQLRFWSSEGMPNNIETEESPVGKVY